MSTSVVVTLFQGQGQSKRLTKVNRLKGLQTSPEPLYDSENN